ncbi:CpXC domain-containing protein [Streptomyces spectabilis]|uniref:CpXC domain-containing protein n=1 Tax=Streptomyces spectabilis TaxID=68270 RepID=A0A516RGZ9_STRST|nr:CpXC domain-containing protein [Streptomyces spectabilis]QDQ14932.1 hypothetical protein FH965_33915 [Streptomyces spectabilis]
MDHSSVLRFRWNRQDCGATADDETYLAVDADARPDLVEKVIGGEIPAVTCPGCAARTRQGVPLLVYGSRSLPQLFFFCPQDCSAAADEANRRTYMDALLDRLGPVSAEEAEELGALTLPFEAAPVLLRPYVSDDVPARESGSFTAKAGSGPPPAEALRILDRIMARWPAGLGRSVTHGPVGDELIRLAEQGLELLGDGEDHPELRTTLRMCLVQALCTTARAARSRERAAGGPAVAAGRDRARTARPGGPSRRGPAPADGRRRPRTALRAPLLVGALRAGGHMTTPPPGLDFAHLERLPAYARIAQLQLVELPRFRDATTAGALGHLLGCLCLAHAEEERYEEAVDAGRRALRIATEQAADDPALLGHVWLNLGVTHSRAGDLAQGLAAYLESWTHCRRADARETLVKAGGNALLSLESGRPSSTGGGRRTPSACWTRSLPSPSRSPGRGTTRPPRPGCSAGPRRNCRG